MGLKIASLALVCALLGGLVGGGTAYLVSNSSNSDTTEVNVSNRKPTEIQVKTVDGKTTMTDAELYAANVNSVVSINITATSEPNFFGQTVTDRLLRFRLYPDAGRLHRHQLPRGRRTPTP